jgi:MOSC domain-containing protein YiiM
MKVVESASFVGGEGISGDRHAGSREQRRDYQVLLMDQETLEALGLAPGTVRENVTTSGFDLSSLASGQRVALGEQTVLQISKPCLPCSRMDEIRPGLQQELEGRRGMLASVAESGTVVVGDTITVL